MKQAIQKYKVKPTAKQIEQSNVIVFIACCRQFGIIGVESEYNFASEIGRRWRFDFAIPKQKIAVEVEGGVWSSGRHTRGAGYVKDMEKYNTATLLGWRVLRFTPQQIKQAKTYELISKLVNIV